MRTNKELAAELICLSSASQKSIKDLKSASGNIEEILLQFVDTNIALMKLCFVLLKANKRLEDKK